MTVARRDLLLGSAVVGLAGGIAPVRAFAAKGSPADGAGALPMPAPTNALPAALPVQDAARVLMDRGWLFHEGDIEPAPLDSHNATYISVKAGNARGAAAVDYDDSDWQAVDLPHDWASFQPFVKTANVAQGYRPRGIGWYRRSFRLDPALQGRRIELEFGGVATFATIWVNGSVVAHNFSGYNAIRIDLTPFARFGDEPNIVAVRVDAEAMEGWWYEGAGLYRHVWLADYAPVSIATDGVHCDPRKAADCWHIPVTATLTSIAPVDSAVTVEARLLDPQGKVVAQGQVTASVPSLEEASATLDLRVTDPMLWSIERPTLYTVQVRLLREGQVADERRVAVGFRTIRFDAAQGFFLNDKAVKLKGVCLHQDHAGVGTAIPDALIGWRLERLKAMGCNAVRSSHNAPTPELLDWCDRLGLVVMDENRQFNPAPEYRAQLEWLVRRDRNHPSVILWSVFNEEPMQGTPSGVEMVKRMAHWVRALDDSRPVTAAMNGAFFDPVNVAQVVDVTGFNYYQGDYDRYHRLNPTKPMTSSEDTSAFMTRGAFESDPARHIASSYDDEAASWGATHRAAWKAIADRPFVAGGFVWTGFDYHGEPTPYEWPTIASFFGIMDLCGFPKTAFDIHRAAWVDDQPVVAIAPHWSWPGREGKPIKVMVLSNAERVVLRLNGKTVGEAAVDRLMGNEWTVPYAPGRIEAIAYRGGQEVARAAHETVGVPVALRLTPARTVMAGDTEDAQAITIDAVDAKGRHVPTANLMTRFTIEGGASIGVGNGDPNSHEPEKGNQRSLFNGLAQMIVRSDTGRGRITIRATADGLKPATLKLDRLGVAPRAQVPVVAGDMDVRDWRRSPLMVDKPSPDLAPATSDNNGWAFVRAGTPTPAEGAGWRVYRTVVTPKRSVAARGGEIRFASVGGMASLWVDGQMVADKRDPKPGPMTATLPSGANKRTIALIVAGMGNIESGLLGRVTVAPR
ncbi:beta-galactosidase GalA [Sphingomonas sanguinis]|uniref:Beta-galactosidase n=1 Tax=Sphingomonas sanguinis TaxID=33051 RepID=A0A147J1X6_9SPHN|nr:beta-galactosidase GalA [Sphingomonas sanguinis]KTW02607.1 beta-galactosidase [Sphingomonas sanguinis]